MKLGTQQKSVLESLKSHGSWHAGCGWIWDSRSQTVAILDSLVRKGVATLEKGVYRPVGKK